MTDERNHSKGVEFGASRARWWVLTLLFLVTVVNFVDRQTLSNLAPDITREFNLSNTAFGTIAAWFRAGMMIGEFPMGILMDRIGVRLGLAFAVLWWSIGNGLHAVANSVWQFRLFRFWLGTGECGNYSGGNKLIARWFPVRERAFAIGVFNSASMLGSFIAAWIIIPIRDLYGWRMGFLIPSLLGVVWVAVWLWMYRQPAEDAPTDDQQSQTIASVEASPGNWELLRLPQVWGLMLCRFWVGAVLDFYLIWMPKYFHDIRGLSIQKSAYFNSFTFIFGDIGSIGGGLAAGWMLARGYQVGAARRTAMLFGAGLCLLGSAAPLTDSVFLAILFISLVLLGHTFLSANMFASISDVFPNAAVARVTGLTGVANGVSGILFPILTGMIVDRFSYQPVFVMAAFMPLLGVLIAVFTLKDFKPVQLS